MRWILALLIAAFALPVRAQDNDGEKLHRDFEKKLTAAKAYKVAFQVDAQIQASKFTFKGNLLAAGNKLRLVVEGKDQGNPLMMTFISDGKRLATIDVVKGQTSARDKPVPEHLGATVTAYVVRIAVFINFVKDAGALTGTPEPPDKIKLTAFKLAGKEKLDSRETQVVECGVQFQGESSKAACKIWFDAQTHMPLKRTIEFKDQDKVFFSVVEVYNSWELEPKLKADDFMLPK
jgi:outer membrane lipoprotein-sorting protein